MPSPEKPALPESPSPQARDHGHLPDWQSGDLPEPLPLTGRNILRTIGPGAILLAGSIGGGEWVIGPLMAVRLIRERGRGGLLAGHLCQLTGSALSPPSRPAGVSLGVESERDAKLILEKICLEKICFEKRCKLMASSRSLIVLGRVRRVSLGFFLFTAFFLTIFF